MKIQNLTLAALAVALTVSNTYAQKMPEIGTGTVVGAIAGVALVSNPVGLAVGAYLGFNHDKVNDRLGSVEQSVDIAHRRLNEHDGHFTGLRDYLERQEGLATMETQEIRKTVSRFPWDRVADDKPHKGKTNKEWAEMKAPWNN